MKTIIKILLGIGLIAYLLYGTSSFAGVVPINQTGLGWVSGTSIDIPTGGGDLEWWISILALSVLGTVKYILSAIIILFLVYAGANMILSMWGDDEKITSSRNQVWYSAIGLLFINIPGDLFEVFFSPGGEVNEVGMTNDNFNSEDNVWSILVNESVFQIVFYDYIVRFLQVTIFGLAIFVIIFAWYQMIVSAGKEEKMTEARNKILYSIGALFFVGFIEAIKRLSFTANLDAGVGIFTAISNLILLFAVPVAMFFLFMAAYYFITSNGDEERVKKARSIVINTFLATILLLAIYTFLLDLNTL